MKNFFLKHNYLNRLTRLTPLTPFFQSGQIVLITLLVLALATTIALSLISRTTTDLAMTNQIEESAIAFSAAEAGIEEALKSGLGTAGAQVLTGGQTYQVNVVDFGGATGVFEYPRKTPLGSVENLWLVNHNSDGSLNETPTFTTNSIDLCWSKESAIPAVVATILYKRNGILYLAKAAFDPDAGRYTTDKFAYGGLAGTHCGKTNMYLRTLTFSAFGITPATDTLIALRLRPVYSETKFMIDPKGGTIPLQGKRIESSGSTPVGVTRKIVVFQGYRAPSSLFDAVLYSQGNLVK